MFLSEPNYIFFDDVHIVKQSDAVTNAGENTSLFALRYGLKNKLNTLIAIMAMNNTHCDYSPPPPPPPVTPRPLKNEIKKNKKPKQTKKDKQLNPPPKKKKQKQKNNNNNKTNKKQKTKKNWSQIVVRTLYPNFIFFYSTDSLCVFETQHVIDHHYFTDIIVSLIIHRF